jgi:rare lipoprotein A
VRRGAEGARRVANGFVAALCAALAACSGTPIRENEAGVSPPAQSAGAPLAKRPGGYYLDDGPGENPPADLAAIPDAVPRIEPIKASTARPYTALGKAYTPNSEFVPYKARGVASWYGRRYHGQRTSSGEVYDMYSMTAAHPTLAIPSYVRVTSLQNGRSVVVRVNDRGPFHSDRLIDLSYVAAWKLGIIGEGSGMVEVEAILPGVSEARVQPARAVASPARQDPVTAPAPASGVFLQLGAFGSRDNAEDFLGKMRVELGDLAVSQQIFVIGDLYRVQAGPYADRAAAATDAMRISDRLGVKPVVVVR